MPFKFQSSNQEQLINTIIIDGNVMTLFYNVEYADKIAELTGRRNPKAVAISHNSKNEEYTYIHDGESEHVDLHVSLKGHAGFHHHVQSKDNFTAHDFAGYLGQMNSFEYFLCIDMADAIKAVVAFDNFSKPAPKNKTDAALEIFPQKYSSSDAYLQRLRQVLCDNNTIGYNLANNRYTLRLNWLKQLGTDARKQLVENLNLSQDDFPSPSL
jgi:hypothetical protein